MKIKAESQISTRYNPDLIAIPYIDQSLLSHPFIDSINKKLSSDIKKLLNKVDFKGEKGKIELLTGLESANGAEILVLGLGKKNDLDLELIRQSAASIVKTAKSRQVKKLISFLSVLEIDKFSAQEIGQAIAEASSLALYQFDKYKGKKSEKLKLSEVLLVASSSKEKSALQSGLKVGEKISEGVTYARDLVNTPPNLKAPEVLAKEAKKIQGVTTKVFDHKKIKSMGMGALYGVGVGSKNPPVFIEMHYKPKKNAKKCVAIVGKGITFDSGGLSLKPAKAMENMKDDMAGAAAVLGIMKTLPKLNPAVEVYGYVSSAENMPGGQAQRPGDVVKAYNGKTVEVMNTDAEGRLALADALSYVTKHRKPDYIIDMATLTGAALVALGDRITAAIGTDDELIQKVIQAGKTTGEKVWELPLEEEYWEGFKSEVADMKNIGGMWGGTINGALFLKQFVDEKAKWLHLDIAGPSRAYKPWPYCPPGGSGIMVRTLIKFLEDL